MAYTFKGKSDERLKPGPHVLASEEEAVAKFAYFREAESKINGGPVPFYAIPDELPPLRPRLDIPECGTYSGYARHIRLKDEPCRPCLDARGHYQREYRAARKPVA
jgi:hypothetical protein